MSFVEYVLEFYGKGGVYDMGVSFQDAKLAIQDYFDHHLDVDDIEEWQYGTHDREVVREILIEGYGYVWGKP